MLVQIVIVVMVGVAALCMFMANQAVSRAAWRVFGLAVVGIVGASIVALMVHYGAFSGPHGLRGYSWATIIACLAYVPFGIAFHRAHVRRVLRKRRAAAAGPDGTGSVMTAVEAPVETNELGDILQMICFILFVFGCIGVLFT